MTPERINEIFQGVQELREWWKTTAQNKELIKIARGNGKSMRAFRYVQSIEVICAALSASENCYNCAHYDTRLCAECVMGCTTNYFTPCATECEKCGLPGFLGKELILHQGDTEERLTLCHECHLKEHTKGGTNET